jgi:DTW domain-containing protein
MNIEPTPHSLDETPACPHCGKPPALCICEEVTPVENRVAVLVLQHPQEQDRLLGTARVATRQLANSAFRIGLSWPSLAKALGKDADPSQWAVLHLGSSRASDMPADREVVVLDRKGAPLPDQDRALADLRGVVLFDGTWSQAKTLWWRNPWVLKARRLVLNPKRRSLYGDLRREPRREGLSTIEAAAVALSAIEHRPEIGEALMGTFANMLARYRTAVAEGAVEPEKAPAQKAGGKRRRSRRPPRAR